MQNGDLVRIGRRRRRARRGGGRALQRIRNVFLLLCAAAILGAVALVAGAVNTYTALAEEMPDLDNYRSTELAQTSTVYDADGEVVEQLYGVQNRFVVGLDDVDPTLRDAVVATEDHRFEEHRGLDFEAIGRAAVENVKTLSIQEGGSTITQQLIKNTYIAQEQRYIPSFQRKFVEGSLAWQYEKEHSKDEILEQYLNTVYFGANAYGAEAAAKTYFNKRAADLTLPESALLAGIINLPGVYDPFADPETAKKRRDVVLDRMLEYGYISQKEHDGAVETGLDLSRGRVEYENDNEYFLNAVRKELAREYGDDAIYEGGLKIYTTLDPELQAMADDAVDSVVDPASGDPSASLVSVDPGTGAVRAMVGGSDFREVKFNLATEAHRQSGSAFKPFVYAEAVDQGIAPETMYVSEHLEVPMGEGEDPYVVDNYDFIERGPINLEKAMADSDNTVFVQLALDLGLQRVVDMAHELGIESEVDAYPSTAIGGLRVGVTPLEMASAYSTFANAGTHMEPYLVQKVTREEGGEEETVEEHRLVGDEALSRDEAAVVTDSLRGVVEEGTASYYHDLETEIGRPAAGKTGTSNEFIDAWFVGFVPQLSTSVWVGYPNERRSMVNINGLEKINGENYPLDIWSLYMQEAVQRFPLQQFDTLSPDLALEVKTDGRTYVKPPPPPPEPEQEATDGETTDGPSDHDPGAEDEPGAFGNDGRISEEEPPESPAGPVTSENRRRSGAAPESSAPPDAPRRQGGDQASPAPASTSPAAQTE
ncbi:MAG: Multimodular transpeptidase-transglycosylase [uncultured Rubrobacteraceae bacterium]|uniref:Multimodular transpeptidase-transglycosylase n=1 Tax=uncultured Rubrobacteraceae bacterium TaxID=349277 RepID=A0A6J4RY33_9ACTN|nr:MAG: Multimodular transpeptidase-transglycosylase [uncultured Rubrobacteraceae bacterium]